MSMPIKSEPYARSTESLDLPHADEERVAFIPGSSRDHVESRGPEADSTQGLQNDDSSRWKSRLYNLYQNNTGLLLISLSQLCQSCMNISVKILNGLDPPVPPFELVAIRMVFTSVFSISYMYHQKIPDPILGPPGVRILLVVRGISGFFGLFGMYYALQYISLSDAVTLTFLTPTVAAIAGYFLLGEGFSRSQAMAGLISLVGVMLIARPEFLFGAHTAAMPTTATGGLDDVGGAIGPAERGTPAQRLGAVGVSLLGVLGGTGAVTCLRAIGTRAHALHTLTYFSSYSILVSILGMLIFRMKFIVPEQWQWGMLLIAIGLFGYAAQVSLALGLQRETASRGLQAKYLQIIFATILERIFFHVYPSYLSILGAAIILTCAIYVALTKKTPPRASKARIADVEDSSEAELGEADGAVAMDDLSLEAKGPGKPEIKPSGQS